MISKVFRNIGFTNKFIRKYKLKERNLILGLLFWDLCNVGYALYCLA
jgi:hypothetical protein